MTPTHNYPIKIAVLILKPLDIVHLENMILEKLSRHREIHSNELFRMLHVGKGRYTKVKDHMVSQGYVIQEKYGNRVFLKRADFKENKEFQKADYAKISRANCKNYLAALRKIRPIASDSKDPKLTKGAKTVLDALFYQLDTIHVIGTRLEYAGAFGLLRQNRARLHKNECMILFDEIIKSLLSDHKKFQNLIVDYYQSQIREMKFKL